MITGHTDFNTLYSILALRVVRMHLDKVWVTMSQSATQLHDWSHPVSCKPHQFPGMIDLLRTRSFWPAITIHIRLI